MIGSGSIIALQKSEQYGTQVDFDFYYTPPGQAQDLLVPASWAIMAVATLQTI